MTGPTTQDPFDASWRERVAVLGTMYLVLVVALVVGLRYHHDETLQLLGLAPAAMFALGKFLPLFALSDQSYFSAYELGFVIWVLDTFNVINVVYAIELFYRIPVANAYSIEFKATR